MTISIFSVSGQLIRVLDLGTLEAGSYLEKELLERSGACWDGTNGDGEEVASGIYLYVLHAGDEAFVDTKKLALIR